MRRNLKCDDYICQIMVVIISVCQLIAITVIIVDDGFFGNLLTDNLLSPGGSMMADQILDAPARRQAGRGGLPVPLDADWDKDLRLSIIGWLKPMRKYSGTS